MKKLINEPADVVEDLIRGLVSRTSSLARVEGQPVVVRADGGGADRGKATRRGADRVTLVSGGGSGHEPAHAGYVGPGMLDAAVLGPIFTSPSTDAVRAAIEAVRSDAGTLLIVKNYTGDVLNFGLAAELARADGADVRTVEVTDDVALGDSSGAGRRGIGGTVLVHKIAGAKAASGASLDEVAAAVEGFLPGLGTMGVALGPAYSPGSDQPNFELADDEIEWGLGIHGESGTERSGMVTSREVAERLVTTVLGDRGISAGDDVAVLVNGLGATPPIELEILTGDVLAVLADRDVTVRLAWSGTFLTSQDMPGASVSIAAVDDAALELLTADAATLAWVPGQEPPATPATVTVDLPDPLAHIAAAAGAGAGSTIPAAAGEALARATAALLSASDELTRLDQQVGDGDLGVNLARGAATLQAHAELLAGAPDLRTFFAAIAELVRREVGGSSGALYALLLVGISDAFDEGVTELDAPALAVAATAGVTRVREIGGADVGDATMMDALLPAAAALRSAADEGLAAASRAALDAARAGADSTAELLASKGRSSYIGERARGVPDPGAVAVTRWLEALVAP